jgi:hypothetical protein
VDKRKMRSLATLALLGVGLVVAAPAAEGRRPAPPGEPTMMLIAIQAYGSSVHHASLTPGQCYSAAVVSTVDGRYGALSVGGPSSACGDRSVLLTRSGGNTWAVVKEASEWYCNDRYAPRAVIEDLFRSCMPTPYSAVFATPSDNIVCSYRGRASGQVWCYVRTTKTLATAFANGRAAQIRRGVSPPEDLRDVRGPILLNGANWAADRIRCLVSQSNSVTCDNALRGRHSAFIASDNDARSLP